MLTQVKIDNFRCFQKFEISPLSRINLITGKNGSGKTALLEAIWLNHGFYNPELGLRVDVFRGIERFKLDELMINLFPGFKYNRPIKISGKLTNKRTNKLVISSDNQAITKIPAENGFTNGESASATSSSSESSFSEKNRKEILFEYTAPPGDKIISKAFIEDDKIHFLKRDEDKKATAVFLSSKIHENQNTLSQRFSDLVIKRKEKKIIEILKIVNSDIDNLSVKFDSGFAVIYADIGGDQFFPLPLLGDGLNRLLSIVLAIAISPNGIVLIDEIENGLHWTVITKVWEAISSYADQNNTQIIATTHSWECIASFQEALSKLSQKDITAKVFRLEQKKTKIQAVMYTMEDLEVSVKQKIEIR